VCASLIASPLARTRAGVSSMLARARGSYLASSLLLTASPVRAMASAARLTPDQVAAVPTAPVEVAKRLAARRAVDEHVRSGMRLGVGSGSTIVYAIQRLAELAADPAVRLDVTCVPTSFQSRNLIVDCGLRLADLNACPELDLAIDGADEVDSHLNCIKGGGACQTQEKLVAAAAARFVLIADGRKQAPGGLGSTWKRGVPIEVLPVAYVPVMRALARLGGKPVLRMGKEKAGPVVTDNGGFVVDADFGVIADPAALHDAIKGTPGVVETGLFPGMAQAAYFGLEDGSVAVWGRPSVDVATGGSGAKPATTSSP
jgi:ribose 5-phosphate isomerase A